MMRIKRNKVGALILQNWSLKMEETFTGNRHDSTHFPVELSLLLFCLPSSASSYFHWHARASQSCQFTVQFSSNSLILQKIAGHLARGFMLESFRVAQELLWQIISSSNTENSRWQRHVDKWTLISRLRKFLSRRCLDADLSLPLW